MTLDDLIALNDEIAALVRAGVPLEQGLAELGADTPGRLGKIVTALAERTARGESLDQALMDHTVGLPPAYQAVVQAGVRAGRLPAALEAVAASARRTTETQRAAIVAVSYPLFVFAVVWCGLAFFTKFLAPRLATSFLSCNVPGEGFFATLAWFGQWAQYWGPAVPVVAVLLLLAWWHACTRAAIFHTHWADLLFGWLPWMRRMLQWSRSATFLEILALLIENQTPLDEAVALAADASGDPKTILAARQLAEAIQRGQTGEKRVLNRSRATPFPAMIDWLVLAAGRNAALLPALKHSAATYHRRARHQSDLIRVLLPTLLTIVVAGSISAAYVLMLFVPYTVLLKALALPQLQ